MIPWNLLRQYAFSGILNYSTLSAWSVLLQKTNLNNLSSLIKLEKMIVFEWISIHLISLWLYNLEMVTQFMWSLHSCITQEQRKL